MASYVKFELEDGTIVYVESTEAPKGASGFPLTGREDHLAGQAAVSFEKSIQSVRKMASVMMQEMRAGFDQPPDDIQVNFGLKASADIGSLVVSRGGGESNYNIMLRWSKEKPKEAEKSEEAAEKGK